MMTPDRIAQIAAAFPWLPADYLRILWRVDPAPANKRFGLKWFDGPQVPGAIGGPSIRPQFPTAMWIARRNGNAVGYVDIDGAPRLQEWRASQRRVVRTYADIAALVLACIIDADQDQRPVVSQAVAVPDLAFASWRNAGDCFTALCILLPGKEAGVIDSLFAALGTRWELSLTREDNDSWLLIRPARGGCEICLTRHGSCGDWQPATIDTARTELLALAPFNLETAVEHRVQCVPWCAEQGAMRRNSQLFRRIATPLCAPGDALRAMERTHPLGEARLNDKILMAHELTYDHQRSTAVSRFNDGSWSGYVARLSIKPPP
jgi:hypothetical protein